MSYTMSFDASIKIKRGDVGGYLKHVARDVDKANGVEVNHSNQDIDKTRTASNITMVYNAETGKFERCHNSQELEAAMEHRLKAVRKPLRSDAVIARPLILQLDPEWYAEHQDQGERQKSYDRMITWAEKTFGRGNVVGYSVHQDEHSPHMHVLVVPVTDDGRLAQKDWFCGPKSLRAMHKDLREHMQDGGYDIDMGLRKPGDYARRLKEGEYKAFRDAQEANREAQRVQEHQEYQEAMKGLKTARMALENAMEEIDDALKWAKSQGYGRTASRLAKAQDVGHLALDTWSRQDGEEGPEL